MCILNVDGTLTLALDRAVNSSAVFAAVAGEPASLTNGDSDCVETSRSLHMLSASRVSCVTKPEASVSAWATAEAELAALRRATAPAVAGARSR